MAKLIDTSQSPAGLFLNNEWVQGGGDVLQFKSAKNGKDLDGPALHSANAADVDVAVANARRALNGPWGRFTGEQRGIALNKLADLIIEHTEEIAYFESICSGAPISFLVQSMPNVAAVYRYYAGWADKYQGDYFPPEDGFYKLVEQTPLGVCAGVTAWNGSLFFLAWKSAPALATGNTVIIKPSEKSPFGTLATAKLISQAGFPPGAFQILPGGGDVGAVLASHMDIDKISFTGSTATGRKIQEAATNSNLKRVTLELGGKSPAVVFDDANLERSLFWCTLGITTNSGQVCVASSRLFVQSGIAEKFIEGLKERFKAIAAGLGADPLNKETLYGPLVDDLQYQRVSKYIQDAKKLVSPLVGGGEYAGDGYYVEPTIFLDPPDEARIYREEIFGPVLCIKTFETEAEAVSLANDTEYGLAGSVFTQDIERALRVSRAIRGGTIGINCTSVVGPQVPTGGFRISGIGRELGEYALRHYTEPKSIWIK
ncbi:hypothetical protein BDW75DRAFT_235257 [Aspergillus navahoensis]